jgi:hypothetical protein
VDAASVIPGIALAAGSGSRGGRVARWSPDSGHARPASTVRPPGMYQAAEHRADDSAMGEVDRIFTDELGWMFTRNQVRE